MSHRDVPSFPCPFHPKYHPWRSSFKIWYHLITFNDWVSLSMFKLAHKTIRCWQNNAINHPPSHQHFYSCYVYHSQSRGLPDPGSRVRWSWFCPLSWDRFWGQIGSSFCWWFQADKREQKLAMTKTWQEECVNYLDPDLRLNSCKHMQTIWICWPFHFEQHSFNIALSSHKSCPWTSWRDLPRLWRHWRRRIDVSCGSVNT